MKAALTADELKTLTLGAADLFEDSFHPGTEGVPGRYHLTMPDAAKKASEYLDIDPAFAPLIALGLDAWWNDVMEWAGDHDGRVPKLRLRT